MSDSNDLYYLSNAFRGQRLFPDSDSDPAAYFEAKQSGSKVEYRGFTMDCTPRLMQFGQYAARVAITDRSGAERFSMHEYSALAYPWTETEAIDIAKNYGMKWVDEHAG